VNNVAYCAHLIATLLGIGAVYRWSGRHRLPKWAPALLFAGALVFEAVMFRVSFPSSAFFDFTECYLPAGAAVLHYDIAALRELYVRDVQGFVNLPVVAYLFAPFALLGPRLGVALYTGIGVGLTVAAWALLVRVARLGTREAWMLAVLFLANGPLLNGLKLGNTSHIILFILVAGLTLLRAGRSGAAGALLGAAAVLKPALLLFGIFFVLRRDVRGTLGFSAVCAASALLSLLVFGWAFNLFWFNTSILQFSHQWFPTFSVQSIPGFLLRLRTEPDLLTSFHPVAQTSGERLAANVLIALLYVTGAAACVVGTLRAKAGDAADADRRRDLQYLLVICLAVVSSPLSWSHYYGWLLMPTAFFLGLLAHRPRARMTRWLGWTAIALLTPLVMWPTTLSSPSLMVAYQSLIESHLLLGGLIWFGLIAWWLAGISVEAPRNAWAPIGAAN
jgi:alpha-1,2-mannosyltransferase